MVVPAAELQTALQKVLRNLYCGADAPDLASLPVRDRSLAEAAFALLTDSLASKDNLPEPIIAALPEQLQRLAGLRWTALFEWHRGEFASALARLDEAIGLEMRDTPDGWAVSDLQRDRRCCQAELANSGDKAARDGLLADLRARSEQPSESKSGVSYYRGLTAAFRRTLQEQIEDIQRPPSTIAFGNSLEPALDAFSGSLEAALADASISLVSSARSDLGHILYFFGRLYNDPDLILSALRLYLLERDAKRIEGLLRTDHQLLFPTLSRAPLMFLDSMRTRTSPLDAAALCAVLEVVGAYTPETRLGDLQTFILSAFDLDSARGFWAVSMRRALQALPRFAETLDPLQVLRRVRPLLADHPVVVSEALRVLASIDWAKAGCEEAKGTAQEVEQDVGRPLPSPGPIPVLRAIGHAWPDAVAPVEVRLLEKWESEGDASAIIYFAESAASLESSTRLGFANHLLDAIEDENRRMQADSPVGFGAWSHWGLLSAYVRAAPDALLERTLRAAADTVLHRYQAIHRKCECIDAILWLHDGSADRRGRIDAVFFAPVLAEVDRALSCSRSSGLIGSTREQLRLRLDELAVAHGHFNYEEVVRDCVQLGIHPSAETRSDAIRLSVRLAERDQGGTHTEIACLLLGRTYDAQEWNAGDAIRGLSSWVKRNRAWEGILASRMGDLLSHGSRYVRDSVLRAAADAVPDSAEPLRFAVLVERGSRDPHYATRLLARKLQTCL
jgi:hypothetical protein